MPGLFAKNFPRPRRTKLDSVTVQNFSGGWNAIDNDISMRARFFVTQKNYRRTSSGSVEVRHGSRWVATLTGTVSGNVLDMVYFNGRLIVVTVNGEIATVDNDGSKVAIWNSAIAALLPSAPSGWSTGLTSIDFVAFKDTLIIHNGVDKPVVVSSAFAVTYLTDAATGSNVNVPIGRYGCTVSNYHVVAGIPAALTTVYISSVGTSGTFPGDPAPNDAISLDVGAYAPEGAATIRGIAGFRQYLIVFFSGQALIMQLGAYSSTGAHEPEFNDTLPQFGLLGHRCILPIENDIHFADRDGVNSAKRNLFSGLIDSLHLSGMITSQFAKSAGALSDSAALYNTFAVQDRSHRETMFFFPSGRVFVHSYNERLKIDSWQEFEFSSPWSAGCHSDLNRLYFASGAKIFQYGNHVYDGEDYTGDREGDHEADWANGVVYTAGQLIRDATTDTVYECVTGHTSAASGSFEADRDGAASEKWEEYPGEPIDGELELPWLDGQNPNVLKMLRFLNVQSKGTGYFTVEAYVDGLYKDEDGAALHTPAVSMEFRGDEARGFGYSDGGFGGGRKSGDPRLYGFPVKFKLIKLRITSSTVVPLEIISFMLLFSRGKFGR